MQEISYNQAVFSLTWRQTITRFKQLKNLKKVMMQSLMLYLNLNTQAQTFCNAEVIMERSLIWSTFRQYMFIWYNSSWNENSYNQLLDFSQKPSTFSKKFHQPCLIKSFPCIYFYRHKRNKIMNCLIAYINFIDNHNELSGTPRKRI